MVEDAYLGRLTLTDILLAFSITILVFLSLYGARKLRKKTKEDWIPRKVVHITISSAIAFSLPYFNSLYGPMYAILLVSVGFLTLIVCGEDLQKFLQVGTRKGEKLSDTFLASLLPVISFSFVYLYFNSSPFVYVTSILFISWGDGAGEVFGRTLGKHKIEILYIHKTVEGSLGVFLLSFLAILISSFLFFDVTRVLTLQGICIALFISVTISVIEFFSAKWVDNLTIPLIGAFLLYFLYFSI